MQTIPFTSFNEILNRLSDAAELQAIQDQAPTTTSTRLDMLIRQLSEGQSHISSIIRKRFRPAVGESTRQPEWSTAT